MKSILRIVLPCSLAVVTLIVTLYVTTNQVSALTLKPDPGTTNPSTGIPSPLRDSLISCDNLSVNPSRKTPGFAQWISPNSDKTKIATTVTPTATSVALAFNWSGVVCFNDSRSLGTYLKIGGASANPAGSLGLTVPAYSQLTGLTVAPNATVGQYVQTGRGFTYTPSGGFKPGTNNYVIHFTTQAINHFDTGAYVCVGGTEARVSSSSDYAPCFVLDLYLNIQVTKQVPPPTTQVEGRKVLANGASGTTANFGDDRITVADCTTPSAVRSDTANPYGTTWNDLASDKCYVVTAANNKPGYRVLGSAWCEISGGMCPNFTNDPKNFPGTGVGQNGKFLAGTSRTLGNANPGADYDVYWVYEALPAGAPVVSLSCNESGGVYTLSGSAVDPDRATALALQFYKSGGAITTGVTSTNSVGNFSVNITPFMGSPASNSSFSVTARGVNSSGAQAPPDNSATTTCTVPSGGVTGTPSNCPGDPTIAANSKVQVTLPDQTPTGRTGAPAGYTTDPNARYEQDEPLSVTTVTSIQDISPGGVRITVPLVNQSYQSATIDYAAYVNGMPYDPNQASVTYDSSYKRTDWYVVADHIQCDGTPASLSGGTCYYSYPASPNPPSCASGFYESGSGKCYTFDSYPTCPAGQFNSDGKCYKNVGNTYVGPSNCPAGTTMYDGKCFKVSNPSTTYYCNNSNEYVNGSTCYGSYTGTTYYRWTNTGPYTKTAANTVNAYPMDRCFDRAFVVDPVTASANYDNDEDPNTVSYSGNTAVTFTPPSGAPEAINGLRTAVKVNLSYDSTITGVPSGLSCPGPSGNVSVDGTDVLRSNGSSGMGSGSCSVSSPPLLAGDRVCIVYNVTPATGNVRINGTPVGGSGTASSFPGCTRPVTNTPYVHILGADSSAGGNFANGILDKCVGATPKLGTITANLRDDGTALSRGSGDQFGTQALGIISRFASASYRTAAPTADRGLTFANPPRPAAAGNLGGQHCVPDFLSTMSSTNTPVSGTLNIAPFDGPGNPDDRQVFHSNGNLTISGGGGGSGIARGNRVAIYVDGDVYIDNDIKFKSTSWPNDKQVPSFFVIANGNIYISPNVTQLDGVYVAQPSDVSSGIINTCAPGFSRYSGFDLFASCINNKLTVNGALVAGRVDFLRTSNSLRNALGGEYPINPSTTASCNGNVGKGTRAASDINQDCAAEVINFSPETFLSEPALLPFGGPTKGKYDFITSLSPIL